MEENVGGTVDLGEAILRHAPEQVNAVGKLARPYQIFDRRTLRTRAYDDQVDPRQIIWRRGRGSIAAKRRSGAELIPILGSNG